MANPLLTVFAEIHANPGKEKAVREVMEGLIEPTRKEEGCVEYILHVDNDKPGHFVVYEIWHSMAHLQAHIATPHLQAFLARSAELLAEPLRVVCTTRVS
jgi:quinol monooxygenase YgiN